MDFIMTVKKVGTDQQWDEELGMGAMSIQHARYYAEEIIKEFNSALQHKEIQRELVGVRIKEDTSEDAKPAKKGDPDFLSPLVGGCWYCNRKEPFTDMCFDTEFDTNVHRGCIKAALERDPEHPEAKLQSYLLDDINPQIAGIEPEEMPMNPNNPANKDTSEPVKWVGDYMVKGQRIVGRILPSIPPDALGTAHAGISKDSLVDILDKEIASMVNEHVAFCEGLEHAKRLLVDYIDKGTTRKTDTAAHDMPCSQCQRTIFKGQELFESTKGDVLCDICDHQNKWLVVGEDYEYEGS